MNTPNTAGHTPLTDREVANRKKASTKPSERVGPKLAAGAKAPRKPKASAISPLMIQRLKGKRLVEIEIGQSFDPVRNARIRQNLVNHSSEGYHAAAAVGVGVNTAARDRITEAWAVVNGLNLAQQTEVVLIGSVLREGARDVAEQVHLERERAEVAGGDIDVVIFTRLMGAQALLQEIQATNIEQRRFGPWRFFTGRVGRVHLFVSDQKLNDLRQLSEVLDHPESRLCVLVDPISLRPIQWANDSSFGTNGSVYTCSTAGRLLTLEAQLKREQSSHFIPEAALELARQASPETLIHSFQHKFYLDHQWNDALMKPQVSAEAVDYVAGDRLERPKKRGQIRARTAWTRQQSVNRDELAATERSAADAEALNSRLYDPAFDAEDDTPDEYIPEVDAEGMIVDSE